MKNNTKYPWMALLAFGLLAVGITIAGVSALTNSADLNAEEQWNMNTFHQIMANGTYQDFKNYAESTGVKRMSWIDEESDFLDAQARFNAGQTGSQMGSEYQRFGHRRGGMMNGFTSESQVNGKYGTGYGGCPMGR